MVSTSSALEPDATGDERAPTHAADDFSQFLKLATEELSRGKLEIALVAASEACHRAPHEPRAHYVYGQAWLALNQPARAQQAFGTAIQLASGWADAWVNYGIARYRQGDIEDAKTAMRQALARAPGHAAAGANLGAFMRISGQSDAGEALLRQTLAREPGNAGARLNLVADLLQSERAAEALALLDAASPPEDVRAQRHW
jgi:Tfp pilus assembly protein PilF